MSNKWIYSAVLVITALFAFFFYQKFRIAPTISVQELPLSDLQSKEYSIEALKGKKVIVCFGASWCINCIQELEVLSKMSSEELTGIEVVVVSDESPEKIERFKEKTNYPFTFVKLNTAYSSIGIHSIPTTYLLNKNLKVVKEHVGDMHWEDPSTLEHYKRLMD